MGADTRIQSDAVDYRSGVEALDLGICVQFVEIRDAEGEVGVGEQLDCLGFLRAHEQGRNIFLDGAFLEKVCEYVGIFIGLRVGYGDDGVVLFVPGLFLA